MKLFINMPDAPGDVLCLTAAVRDLRKMDDEIYVNVRTTAQELWDNNPNLDRSITPEKAHRVIKAEYPGLNHSMRSGHHIDSFRRDLERQLGMRISPGPLKPDLHLRREEMELLPALGEVKNYWILSAAYKDDCTCKGWGTAHFQKLVDLLAGKVTFVQVGERSSNHHHAPLTGVVDLLGQTTHRQFVQLMYRARGCVTGVSYPMHMAAGVPMEGGGLRPCFVLAGGREPNTYFGYPGHHVFHTLGALDCCRERACWRNRVVKLNDGSDRDNSLCFHPEDGGGGQIVPRCMNMISPEEVAAKIERYLK